MKVGKVVTVAVFLLDLLFFIVSIIVSSMYLMVILGGFHNVSSIFSYMYISMIIVSPLVIGYCLYIISIPVIYENRRRKIVALTMPIAWTALVLFLYPLNFAL